MKKSILWLVPFCTLLILGCQESSSETDSQQASISKPLQAQIQNPAPTVQSTITFPPPPQAKSTTEALGITVDNGKIIIDTRQTKDFLRNVGDRMKNSFKRIEENLKKERIRSPNETGIIVTDTKVQIDLNQTKNFMEKWMRSMESIVKELNKTMGEIERSLPQR